jgi:hypothetical protein
MIGKYALQEFISLTMPAKIAEADVVKIIVLQFHKRHHLKAMSISVGLLSLPFSSLRTLNSSQLETLN